MEKKGITPTVDVSDKDVGECTGIWLYLIYLFIYSNSILTVEDGGLSPTSGNRSVVDEGEWISVWLYNMYVIIVTNFILTDEDGGLSSTSVNGSVVDEGEWISEPLYCGNLIKLLLFVCITIRRRNRSEFSVCDWIWWRFWWVYEWCRHAWFMRLIHVLIKYMHW